MNRRSSSCLAPLVFALAAAAQEQPVAARSFTPPDYGAVVFVDVARLDDLGLLGELQRSPLQMLGTMFREEFGFSIDHLERVSLFMAEAQDQSSRRPRHSIWVFEGSESVGLDQRKTTAEPERIGNAKLLETDAGLLCSPRPGLLLLEPREGAGEPRLRDLLTGKAQPGVPLPTLLEVNSRPGAIAQIARVIPRDPNEYRMLLPGVGEDWAEESDPPDVMSLRLAEDPKSKELSVTLLVRFASGESGPARLEGRVAEALAEARKNDRVALFRELFERITTKTAGRDFVATLPLGAGREALGRLTKFALMLGSIGMTAESVVLEEVEVVEAVEVEPVPVEEKPVEKPVPPPPERRR